MKFDLPLDHADFWLFDFDQLKHIKPELEHYLSSQESIKLKQFKDKNAATTFFYSKSITRFLLGKYLNRKPQDIKIHKKEHGKPEIVNNCGLHFNVSHSAGFICFIFSPVTCGIDIENLQRVVDYEQIIKRFFSTTEIQSWKNNFCGSKSLAFFRGWTRKEAFLKATGDGITGLSKFDISFEPCIKQAIISNKDQFANKGNWFFHEFLSEPDYICSLVLKKIDLPVIKRKFNFFPSPLSE